MPKGYQPNHEPKTTPGSAIGRIATRYRLLAGRMGNKNVETLVKLYHEKIQPLRLTALARASDIHLAHDIGGIVNHRYADGTWTPRYSARR